MWKLWIAAIALGWIVGIAISQMWDGPQGIYSSQIERAQYIERF